MHLFHDKAECPEMTTHHEVGQPQGITCGETCRYKHTTPATETNSHT
jgi:hypothetical protein